MKLYFAVCIAAMFSALLADQMSTAGKLSENDADADADGEYLCDSTVEVIYPEVGIIMDSTKLPFKNSAPIRVERCRNEGTPCKIISSLTNSYNATCKQSYTIREFYGITENGTIVKDTFKVENGCKCFLKKF